MNSLLKGRIARTWVAVVVLIACACLVIGVGAWVLKGKGKGDPAAGAPPEGTKVLVPAKDGGFGLHLPDDGPPKAGEKRKIAVSGGGHIEVTPVEGAPPEKAPPVRLPGGKK